MSFQDQISRKLYKYQNELQSFNVRLKGTEVSTILLHIIEDKYGNSEMTITKTDRLTCVIDFPQDEIPVSLSSTQDNMSENSTQVLHLFDLLPISCFFKNEDIVKYNIRKGMILLYKLKMADGNFQVIEFQITDCISKGNPSSGILYSEFTISPTTDFALRNTDEYKEIIEEYKNSDIW